MATKVKEEETPEEETPAPEAVVWKPGETFDPSKFLTPISRKDKSTGLVRTSQYLGAPPRQAWFRSEHPIGTGWKLISLPVQVDLERGVAYFEGQVISPDGTIVANAFAYEERSSFFDFIQKADTDCKSRALGAAGYAGAWEAETEDPPERPQAPVQHQYNRRSTDQAVVPATTQEGKAIAAIQGELKRMERDVQAEWRKFCVNQHGVVIENLRGDKLQAFHAQFFVPEEPREADPPVEELNTTLFEGDPATTAKGQKWSGK